MKPDRHSCFWAQEGRRRRSGRKKSNIKSKWVTTGQHHSSQEDGSWNLIMEMFHCICHTEASQIMPNQDDLRHTYSQNKSVNPVLWMLWGNGWWAIPESIWNPSYYIWHTNWTILWMQWRMVAFQNWSKTLTTICWHELGFLVILIYIVITDFLRAQFLNKKIWSNGCAKK